METGGWGNGYTGDGQVANRKCTLHTHVTEHGFEPRSWLACRGAIAFVFLGYTPSRSNRGCRLLPKRAKKHSIAADCSRDTMQARTLPATNKERAQRTRDPRSGGAYVVHGLDNAWRSRAPGPHAHGNAARQVVDGLRTEVCGQQN